MPGGDSNGDNRNIDIKREVDTIRQLGFIKWYVLPPYDLLFNMIDEVRRVINLGNGSKNEYWGNMRNILPKLFMVSDTYGVHYIPWDELLYRREDEYSIIWHLLMREYMRTREYRMIRAYTTGSEHMSFHTGVWLVMELLKSLSELTEDEEWIGIAREGLKAMEGLDRAIGKEKPSKRRPSAKSIAMAPAGSLGPRHRAMITGIARRAAMSILEGVEALGEYENALNQLRVRAPGALGAVHSKGLESSSLLFTSPEEVRRRARILTNITRLVDEFKPAMIEGSITGVGYPSGYTISSKSLDLAVKEFMYPEPLRTLRLVTQHLALERTSGRRFNIIIDRSGSMGEEMPGSSLEKVSIAAALAISMIMRYGEYVSTYAFDVELHELGKGSMTIEPLLSLTADGGTSVKTALKHALESEGESIIITDAIDPDVNINLARKALERTRLIILEPADYYDWVEPFIREGKAVMAKSPEDVIEFLNSPGSAGGS